MCLPEPDGCLGLHCGRTEQSYASNTTLPPTTVATARPVKFQPSNGVLRDFESDCAASKVHFFFGSKMVTSACALLASVPRPCNPNNTAGLVDISSTTRDRGSPKWWCRTVRTGQRRLQTGDT